MATATRRRPTRDDLRESLMTAAGRLLETDGPEALQARTVAVAAGTSTQALYTVFGGTAGLIEALVADGFRQMTAAIDAIPETDDAVADHLTKGWAYWDWALAHPQRYRLMYGLTGGVLRPHAGVELTLGGVLTNLPEGRAAAARLVGSLERVLASGRIRDTDPILLADQMLVLTHGTVLLQIAGGFGSADEGLRVLAELSVNVFVGLGDRRARIERSLAAAVHRHSTPQRPAG